MPTSAKMSAGIHDWPASDGRVCTGFLAMSAHVT